ncbi:hypothetical protein CANCADRAFT_1907 [Tortispora caseinolytica NRRL Y-17796]|uniref:DNA endonuclease activator Ctp1 C-terminal domain-containing protein n=1 Tax=Tortispora caseinolytica NRRL Y-17796 TaxID=767744 RepID=A0A1E4TEJ7_9ASCO|nr:hypothetical protein CANCADRAFT_1907 [Tortispora caseinolytica NRRL Y-17796]
MPAARHKSVRKPTGLSNLELYESISQYTDAVNALINENSSLYSEIADVKHTNSNLMKEMTTLRQSLSSQAAAIAKLQAMRTKDIKTLQNWRDRFEQIQSQVNKRRKKAADLDATFHDKENTIPATPQKRTQVGSLDLDDHIALPKNTKAVRCLSDITNCSTTPISVDLPPHPKGKQWDYNDFYYDSEQCEKCLQSDNKKRCRHSIRYIPPASPEGLWRTGFANSQEKREDSVKTEHTKRMELKRRYEQAIKPNGAYRFSDKDVEAKLTRTDVTPI